MTLKRNDVYVLYGALTRMNEVSSMKVAYAIAKTMNAIETEVKFADDQRNRLVKKYGEDIDGNISISQNSPKWDDFVREYGELMMQDVDVEIYQVDPECEADFMADGVHPEDYRVAWKYMLRKSEPTQ